MTPLKARIWNRKDKTMRYLSARDDLEFRFLLSRIFIDGEFELNLPAGMKDMRGRDIYEGDILRECEYSGRKSGFGLCVVVWSLSGQEWKSPWIRKGLFDPLKRPDAFEIVGNAFERPELLPFRPISPI